MFFLPDLTIKLPKFTNINNYIINLIENKQILYNLIYNLGLIELEILKIYIKIDLTNKFI